MADYKFYILLCAAFNPKLLTSYEANFKKYAAVIRRLVDADDQGASHLFQAIVQYFIKRFPDQKPHASELCMILYNESVIEDQFFINWHAKKLKTDRDSQMYDHKAEKAMRSLLNEFVEWLQSAEYDEEAGKWLVSET